MLLPPRILKRRAQTMELMFAVVDDPMADFFSSFIIYHSSFIVTPATSAPPTMPV
jgi:hypothetical protein